MMMESVIKRLSKQKNGALEAFFERTPKFYHKCRQLSTMLTTFFHTFLLHVKNEKRHPLGCLCFLVAEMGFEPHGLAKFSAENLSAVILAVLTVHRTVIHCRSAVHKTLCVLLTTSELFALRAHNPAPTWLQPTLQAKRKATRMGCFLFGCGDGI